MRILLMVPYDDSYHLNTPDLGLGYLAACLQKESHSVQLSLRPKEFSSSNAFSEFIRQGSFDIIGIKVMSPSAIASKETIKLIRDVDQTSTIVLGGPQVTGDPHNVLRLFRDADYAFHGESEIGLVKFVRELSSGDISEDKLKKIPNLIWRNGNKTNINVREIVNDLDSLPFPAWDLMEPKKFPCIPFNGYSRRYPIAPFLLTRGCPNKCTFCSAGLINEHMVRSRSVENIMEEIDLLIKCYGVKEIQIIDSNCAHRQGPLKEMCRRFITDKIDLTWSAPNGIRIDSIDEELADLMKRSGCFQVSVGIESGSPRILKKIKKAISPELVRRKVNILRNVGVDVNGFFMIGFPGETKAEIKQTLSLAMELPLTSANFSIFCPLPGTELFKETNDNKNVDLETLQSLDFVNFKNNLSEVSYDELRSIQKNVYWRFHLRPRPMLSFLRNFNNLHKVLNIVNRVYVHAFR